MAQGKIQNFANHTRFVPAFHFFIVPVLLVNFIQSLVQLRNGIGFTSVLSVLVAAALLTLAFARAHLCAHGPGPHHPSGDAAATGRPATAGLAAAHR